MNRREFLKNLLGTAASVAVPAAVTYVLPPPNGWRMQSGLFAMNNASTPGWVDLGPAEVEFHYKDYKELRKTVDEVIRSHENGMWFTGNIGAIGQDPQQILQEVNDALFERNAKLFAEYYEGTKLGIERIGFREPGQKQIMWYPPTRLLKKQSWPPGPSRPTFFNPVLGMPYGRNS